MIKGTEITYKKISNDDYISLTDMAKYKNEEIPAHVISHWMSTKHAIEFIGIWETIYNPNFNLRNSVRLKMLGEAVLHFNTFNIY